MKRILALMLALVMCFSLCACGGRDVASPGSADEETTGETANNADDNVSGDAVENDTDASVDNDTNENVVAESDEFISSSGSIAAPESTEKYNYASSGADIEISYGEGMNVAENVDGHAVVE